LNVKSDNRARTIDVTNDRHHSGGNFPAHIDRTGSGQPLRGEPEWWARNPQPARGKWHDPVSNDIRRGAGHRQVQVLGKKFEINYGHTSNSQIYSTPPLTYRIQNTIAEYSGAYVFSFHQSDKIEPFVFAGAAALIFYPSYSLNTVNDVQTYLPASQQTKPAFLYGGGLDYRIFSSIPLVRRAGFTKYLAVRLQYRGLIYKAPDFDVQNLFTGARGHMAEPTIGIVVKF